MTIIRFTILGILCVVGACQGGAAEPPVSAILVDVRRIWDRAPHNAFTDLVRWQDKWYCGFREGQKHVGDRGKMRIVVSRGGEQWQSAVELQSDKYDLRDATLSITPDDQLMVLGGAQQTSDRRLPTGTFVSFSRDGVNFTPPKIILPPGRWLWRVTWRDRQAYGVSYPSPDGAPFSSLLVSDDGMQFLPLVSEFLSEGGQPTEARILFSDKGMAYCLHRRDGRHNSAFLGKARSPYTRWKWLDLKQHLGGPNFLQLPIGHWIAAGRSLVDGPHTSIMYLDVDHGTLTPLLQLPSAGDNSYPGMVWHRDQLWVSYYSSHEKGTNIYLARVAIQPRP